MKTQAPHRFIKSYFNWTFAAAWPPFHSFLTAPPNCSPSPSRCPHVTLFLSQCLRVELTCSTLETTETSQPP